MCISKNHIALTTVSKTKRPNSQSISKQSLSSKISNEGISHVFTKPAHIDATADLLFDEIKEESLDDETDDNICIDEIDLSELAVQRGKIDGLKWKVHIVREEPRPNELVKEEPPFYDGFQHEYETQPTND